MPNHCIICGPGMTRQKRRRLDAAVDVVFDQDSAQRSLAGDDRVAHHLRAKLEADADETELHDAARRLQREQNLAGVVVAFVLAVEDADVDQAAVVVLDGHRHVVFVDQQFSVRLRHLLRRHILVRAQVIRRREESEQTLKVRCLRHRSVCRGRGGPNAARDCPTAQASSVNRDHHCRRSLRERTSFRGAKGDNGATSLGAWPRGTRPLADASRLCKGRLASGPSPEARSYHR